MYIDIYVGKAIKNKYRNRSIYIYIKQIHQSTEKGRGQRLIKKELDLSKVSCFLSTSLGESKKDNNDGT